jgi:hypothetical protein
MPRGAKIRPRRHEAEDDVAGVAVGPARSRREQAVRLLLEQGQDLVVTDLALGGPDRPFLLLGVFHEHLVVGQTGGVGQQVADRHAASVRGKAGKGPGQGVVVAQPAVAHEQHDRGRRHLLRHRGEAEARAGVDRRARAQVANAVPVREDGSAIGPHEHGQARLAVGDESLQARGRQRFTVDGGRGAGEKEEGQGKHGASSHPRSRWGTRAIP